MASLLALPLIAKVALGATAAGTIMNTVGNIQAAKDAKNIASVNAANTRKVAEYNAAINEQAAGQEEAASQMKAREAKRQSRLMQSRVLALAAASGGGAMDMDVLNTIAGFEEEGDLAARTELYQGSERARQLRMQGDAGIWQGETQSRKTIYEGNVASSQFKRRAVGTILGGASSLASKYGEYKNA